MSAQSDLVEKYCVLALRYYFGGHTLISGVNYFWEIFPDKLGIIIQNGGMTGRFMSVLADSGLYNVCKIIEIAVGLALLLGTFVPLALIAEVPVTIIIFYESVFMNGSARTTFTGWRELVLNFGLLTAYWGYFTPIFLQPMLQLKPIWRDSAFMGGSKSPQ